MPYTILMVLSDILIDVLKNNLPVEASHTSPIFIGEIQKDLRLAVQNSIHKNSNQKNDSRCYYFLSDTPKDVELYLNSLPNKAYCVAICPYSMISARKYPLFRSDKHRHSVGINTIYLEPAGKLSFIKHIRIPLGSLIPNSSLSPYTLAIFQKNPRLSYKRYIQKTTILTGLRRLNERVSYRFKNSYLHDIYCSIARIIRSVLPIKLSVVDKLIPNDIYGRNLPANKKILIATGHLAFGGVEKVLLNIIAKLSSNGYNVVLCTTIWNENAWQSEFKKHCSQVINIPQIFGHTFPTKYHLAALKKIIHHTNPDIYFITNSELGYFALPSVKSSTHAVDLLHTYGTPSEKDAFLRISKPYDKYINIRVVISEFLKKYLISNYMVSDDKVKIIYNGLTNDIAPISNSVMELNKHITSSKKISYVGRLQKDKSPERLVYLAAECKEILNTNNAQIIVVGDGSMRSELETMASKLGVLNKEIVFIGYQQDIPSILSASTYTIITSNLEGVPMSVLESMQHGTPVISTAVGGIPEVINSDSGFLVPLNQETVIKDFKNTVAQALAISEHNYKNMQEICKKTVRDKFSNMPNEYLDLFNKIVK